MQRETSELDHKRSCASFSPVQSTDETMSTCSAETVCESIGQLSVQSTDDIVSEILSDLLTEVCSKDEQWDIATRSTLAPLASSPPLNSTATVDVCGIVRQQMSGQVLCGYCDWRAGWEVLQLRCVEQRAAGYCGHYALYLTIIFLELARCGGREQAVALLQQTTSVAGFWRRYWVSIGILLRRVRAHPDSLWWPWTEHNVLLGEMERSYLAHLLTSDPCITALGGRHHITVLHFAYGLVQNTTDDIIAIQQSIDWFRGSRPPQGHVFILGVTNHWVTMYAYYTPPPAEQGCGHAPQGLGENAGLCLVYVDSNNVAVLGASDSQIEDIVREKERERVRVKGCGYTPWKRGVVGQALRDQRDLVALLADCLSGEQSLPRHVVSHYWSSVVDSFQQHVAGPAGEGDMFLPLLLQWLESQQRPHSLRDHQVCMLRDLGADQLSSAVRERLLDWLHCCHVRLAEYCGGIELLDVFMSALEQLDELLEDPEH